MEVRNCRNCGRLFNYLGGPNICPACRDEVEKKFQDVKEFIRENPRANIQEISEANEVSSSQIRQWIREERLEFSKDSPLQLLCEQCGDPITTGRFCAKCRSSMANNLSDTVQRAKPQIQQPVMKEPKAGMRFLDT